MTLEEADAEAQKLWGAPGPLVTRYGGARDDGTGFGRRYQVGVWEAPTPQTCTFTRYGDGSSWQDAFTDAKRRRGLGPRVPG